MSEVSLKLLVEGWRQIPHSYAIVNQFHCLEMLRRPTVKLFHREMPYFNRSWQRVRNLFDETDEQSLLTIPSLPENEKPDAIFRIDFPHRFDPVSGVRTLVFLTSEFQDLPKEHIAGGQSLEHWHCVSDVILITPSEWSRAGLLRSGADPKRVFVIPHGIDTRFFHAIDSVQRDALRRRMGWNGFYFMSIGSMTGNKGIHLLLKAFAAVVNKYPDSRLFLKGADALYRSKDLLINSAGMLTPEEIALVQPRLLYSGNSYSFRQISELYHAADAYVSPYSGEGFNMPVLEAAACGLPVICTQGGSTDDFTAPGFTYYISATKVLNGQNGTRLNVSYESLVTQMFKVIEDDTAKKIANITGPAFVRNGFLWSQVVDKLLTVLAKN